MTWRPWAKFYNPFHIIPHLKPVTGVTYELKKRSWHCYIFGNADSLLRYSSVSVMYYLWQLLFMCPVLKYLLNYSVLTCMCLHEALKIRAHTEIFLVSLQRIEKQMLRFFFSRPTSNLSICHHCDHTVLSVWWASACILPRRKKYAKITRQNHIYYCVLPSSLCRSRKL